MRTHVCVCVCVCVCMYACERVTASRKCRPLQGWPGSCHRGQHALPAREQGAGGGAICGAGRHSRKSPPEVHGGCSLCPEGSCSLQLLHGRRPRHSHPRRLKSWPSLVPSSRVGGEGSGMAPGSTSSCPERREELLRGLLGCSGLSSSLYGALVGLSTHVAPRLS